jgi:hypothetical protein
MRIKKLKQKDLVDSSYLSIITIKRICRDWNDKGGFYKPSRSVVAAISIGLKLTPAEAEELKYIAFPEEKIWEEGIRRRLPIYEVNDLLYNEDLPPLGNVVL